MEKPNIELEKVNGFGAVEAPCRSIVISQAFNTMKGWEAAGEWKGQGITN